MPYAARADLASRFGTAELDDLAPIGAGGASKADQALADASAEVDAVLGRSYALPLAGGGPWPSLTDAACRLARLKLFDDGAGPKAARREADAARKRLSAIADGTIELVGADGAVVPRATRASFDGAAPMFRRASLRDA